VRGAAVRLDAFDRGRLGFCRQPPFARLDAVFGLGGVGGSLAESILLAGTDIGDPFGAPSITTTTSRPPTRASTPPGCRGQRRRAGGCPRPAQSTCLPPAAQRAGGIVTPAVWRKSQSARREPQGAAEPSNSLLPRTRKRIGTSHNAVWDQSCSLLVWEGRLSRVIFASPVTYRNRTDEQHFQSQFHDAA
jgi:hypothetical protein